MLSRLTVNGEDVFPRREERTAGLVGEDQVLTPMVPIEFYGPGVFPYEDVYLAFIPVFYHRKGSAAGMFPSASDIQLAVLI